jgi:hypothetical protein
MSATDVMVRVYRLPEKLTNGFAFGSGTPIEFTNVDWFEVPRSLPATEVRLYVARKPYFHKRARFLVLGDAPHLVFTIEPERASAPAEGE